MKKTKRFLSMLLTLCMILSAVPSIAFATETSEPPGLSGNCGAEDGGSNLTWEIEMSTNTLTINGQGAMADYFLLEDGSGQKGDFSTAPWFAYDWSYFYDEFKAVERVIIGEEVTYIGDYAFFSDNKSEFIQSVYFCGDAPDLGTAVSLSVGLYYDDTDDYVEREVTFYYIEGKSGWTDSDAYDPETGTWNGYKLATWDGLQDKENIQVGDFITLGSFNNHPLLWQVISIENGKLKLFCSEILFKGEIDAAMHEVLAYANLVSGAWEGDSNWHTSDIRTYLNSTETSVSYKGADKDELPSYSSLPGFLSCFSAEELALISVTSHRSNVQYHRTLTDSDGGNAFATMDTFPNIINFEEEAYENLSYINTTEKVFLPSAMDLKKASESLSDNLYTEFAYDQIQKNYYVSGMQQGFWLREPVIFGSSYLFWGMYFLNTSDSELAGYATFYRGIRPMCYIQLDAEQKLSGNGTVGFPYALTFGSSGSNSSDKLQIVSRAPENRGVFSGDKLVVSMTFNREIESVQTGFSSGNFSIVRQIEEADGWKFETVYTLEDVANDVTIDGKTVTIDTSDVKWIPGETYYVQLGPKVITFKETDEQISISGTEWLFTTGMVSAGDFRGMYGSTFPYDDSYFTGRNSDIYNHDLAIASCNLAISAFNYSGAEAAGYQADIAGKTVKNMLEQLDFHKDNIDISSYEGKPTEISIASAIATKKLNVDSEDWTLLTIAVRGGNYEAEWGGNFWIGQSGNHVGFQGAANQIKNRLKAYIKDHPLEGNVAVWITGYSRAAATANLLSADLNTKAGASYVGLDVDSSNIYTYTFETPMGADESNLKTFDNIFNLVNPIDLVPKVAPSAWDFTRFGVDCMFPSSSTTSYYSDYLERVSMFYEAFTGKTLPGEFTAYQWNLDWDLDNPIPHIYMTNDIESTRRLQADFLESFINDGVCTDFMESRTQYYNELQSMLTDLLASFYSKTIDTEELKAQILSGLAGAVADWMIEHRLIKIVGRTPVKCVEKIAEVSGFERNDLAKRLAKILIESNAVDMTQEELAEDIRALLDTQRLLEFLVGHSEEIYTLLKNYRWLADAHRPEFCLAWMNTVTEGYMTSENGRKYRKLIVNCPVDIQVYDSTNVLVAAIIDNHVQDVPGSTIDTCIDENGQKIVILPTDETYKAEITATDKGTMTYSVSEYDLSLGKTTRIVNYFDVELTKGEKYSGTVEALEDDTPAEYPLQSKAGELIPVSEDLRGEDVERYTVQAKSTGSGVVNGGGIFNRGEYVLLTAFPEDGASFKGWYNRDKLVSTEAEYRFCVLEDVVVTAKFTSLEIDNDDSSSTGSAYPSKPIVSDKSETAAFSDVAADAYYADAVAWAVENGVTSGTTAATFTPNAVCTRAQMVTFLWRAAGSPAPRSASMPFADVAAEAYYRDAVLWAVEQGITSGTTATTFSPDNAVTRAQTVTLLWRAQKSPIVDAANPFADVAAEAYYHDAVLWAVEQGITSGTTATTFSPNNGCTRAQIVTFLWRMTGK